MLRLPTCVVPCSPCDKTASAALMKGWISSIFMTSGSRAGGVGPPPLFTHHVLDNFVQHFRLHRLLHEMPCSPLQRRNDVFLVAHGRHHNDASLGMRLYNFLGRFDSFHLRHGDIHEHDVGPSPVELADGGQPVSGFGRHLSAECLYHAGQVLAGEHGVIHDQIANRLPVFAAFYRCKLLHNQTSSYPIHITAACRRPDHPSHELMELVTNPTQTPAFSDLPFSISRVDGFTCPAAALMPIAYRL